MPALSVADLSLTEGNSGTSPATFSVSLSAPAVDLVSVQYATANDTASAGSDYTAATGTLSFGAGESAKQVQVLVLGDTLNELNESFRLNLSNATNASLADAQGVASIVDDDPVPALAINDVTVTEGNSGNANAVFTVALSAPSGQVVSVSFLMNDGTASGSTDFTPDSGILSFNPGNTAANVSVGIKGDTAPEADEGYSVVLSAPLNATLAKATGVGTIADDDGFVSGPRISIDDRSVLEGSAVNAAFRLTLSAPGSQTVTVNYTTANGTATAPSDYATTSGTLSFSAGRTSHSIFALIATDITAEGNESFFVNLSSPTNATIARGQATGTIGDSPSAAKITMYRSYNKSTDYHFFTTDLASKNFAVTVLGFQDESNPPPFYVSNVLLSGTVPLFCMYNPNLGRHFYTASSGSRDFLMGIGAVYEKEEGFVYPMGTSPPPAGTTELFLLYNNNSGTHLFTADAQQKDGILSLFPGIWVQHTSVGLVFTQP